MKRERIKRLLSLGLLAALLLLCAVCLLAYKNTAALLSSQSAAQRWRGDNETAFAQISCFASTGDSITEEEIYNFRSAMLTKLKDASFEVSADTPLIHDAWCGFAQVNAANGQRKGKLSVTAVGGSYFDFHPIKLVSGAYLSPDDLMKDRVLLDRESAWLLFGGEELSGMSFEIEGQTFYVAGVIEREDDRFSKRAYDDGMGIYMHYEAYKQLNENAALDDNGNVVVNRGFRIQFNSAIGPYKGGLRFHPSVNESIIKFLGFEQTFKNSLTSLPMGGGKGGSDFDPQGKSDAEVMRFCQSFMTELQKYIGPDTDVPAGDIGVGAREIGYLFGQYKRLRDEFTGVLTGKGIPYGGSLIRPEATGFGAVYYTVEMLKYFKDDIKGKTFAISGFGNVAWGTVKKVTELGGKVVTISGPDGYVYDPDGINTPEKIDYMLEMRASCRNRVEDYADKFGVQFFKGEKPWGVKADIIMPCATQNEVDVKEAEQIVANGVKYYVEVSNMPTTNEAIAYLKANGVIIAPSKAVNAGGVSVSGLEMSQNSMRYSWSAEEVDAKLYTIMANIFANSIKAANEYGFGDDLVAGANIAGFIKVADAMLAQGVC